MPMAVDAHGSAATSHTFLTPQALAQSILNYQQNLLILLQGNESIFSLMPAIWVISHSILWAKDAV
jgi:hypothetical protein